MRRANRTPGFTAEAALLRRRASLPQAALGPGSRSEADRGRGEATIVPAMRCVWVGDEGFCCNAYNYCCVWASGSSPRCGHTS